MADTEHRDDVRLVMVCTVIYTGEAAGEAHRDETVKDKVMAVFASDGDAQSFIDDVNLGGETLGYRWRALLQKRWRWALVGAVHVEDDLYEERGPIILVDTDSLHGDFGVSSECLRPILFALEEAAKKKKRKAQRRKTQKKPTRRKR